ncbi:unnamed protein product [Closterium sp. Naga37s-1]|nr:unnamed protein product [Closterium sp. Naga37s-1]CAI5527804.1 unnamed protein product [Closterium sp. Naga37s-1]
MLTTSNEEGEEDEEAVAAPVQAPDEDLIEARARYMRTSGFRADDALWHQRLGHPSRVTLENCIKAGVFAPGTLPHPDGSEEPTATLSYSDFLNVGHCGIDDELYTLTFIDAGTRYVWVVNVEARSRAYEAFRLWLAHAQRQSGEKLKVWQSDGAAEFRSKEPQDYLAQKGIEHHISLPYAHQQQGVAERTNRTLMTKVRALMKQSKLPPIYWTYAMHHAVRVHNLLSTTAITGNLSPHVKWTGTKGDTSMLRVQKIKHARDVIFYEHLFLQQFREDEQTNAKRVYANDGHSYATPEDEAAAAILEQDPRGEFTRGDCHDADDDDNSGEGGAGTAGGATGGSESGGSTAPPAPPEPESDDDDVQEVVPQHRHDSTVTGMQLLGLHAATSTTPHIIEPKNPRQALTGPHSKEWCEAMDAEIRALESRDTWVLVDRAAVKGRRILSGKWVFRVKTAADGTIERFKARWVVRGYDQRHGIDFDQTFAPVSRHTSVRILLAIAAAGHLPLRQIDVKNTFLYALVDAVIYVEQPHTYDDGDPRVCQLRKSLYGIKQAPRLWQQYLHNILLEIGFKQLPHDPGMYCRDFRGEYILLTVYVDDLLYTGSSPELLEQFEKNLAGRVDITCNHDVKQFLGLNITYSPEAIHLSAANLIGYVDADHAADPDNRRYRTGFLFRLEPSGPISWNSQKQELVALSSAETEFIAATAAVREGLYLQELLQEAKIPASANFRLHCDNQSAIRIANKSGFVNRTKHIALRYFFVKDEVDKGKVDLTYCPTGDVAADFLTKKLPRQQYLHCSELSGVVKRVKTCYGQE